MDIGRAAIWQRCTRQMTKRLVRGDSIPNSNRPWNRPILKTAPAADRLAYAEVIPTSLDVDSLGLGKGRRSFLKKRTKRLFWRCRGPLRRHKHLKKQKSFASFLQKRRPCLLPPPQSVRRQDGSVSRLVGITAAPRRRREFILTQDDAGSRWRQKVGTRNKALFLKK